MCSPPVALTGRPVSATASRRPRGFSLLEMVVAVAILGMSLGALYRAAGGATRIVAKSLSSRRKPEHAVHRPAG